MEIDYKTLLIKYIEHVGQSEGADFIGGGYSSVNFTDDEMKALREARDAYREYEHGKESKL
jgi:hypothetical protein